MYHPTQYAIRRNLKAEDIPDCIWPTDNIEDIPLLRADLQGNALDIPIIGWGSIRRTTQMLGTWHFYVDDYRFNHLWKDPSGILNSGCVNIIEPNFSINDQTPRAIALYRTYQKRYLARLWQEFGNIRVFVDMNVGMRYQELNLLGVPKEWRSYATRGYKSELSDIESQYHLACQHRGSEDILFVVYGGNIDVRNLCLRYGFIWLPEQRDLAKGKNLATIQI